MKTITAVKVLTILSVCLAIEGVGHVARASDLPSENQVSSEIMRLLPAGAYDGYTPSGSSCEVYVRSAEQNGYFQIAGKTEDGGATTFEFDLGSSVSSFTETASLFHVEIKEPLSGEFSDSYTSIAELQLSAGHATAIKFWQTGTTSPAVECIFN